MNNEMEAGYRALTKEDIRTKGDQRQGRKGFWVPINCRFGVKYKNELESTNEYRRPVSESKAEVVIPITESEWDGEVLNNKFGDNAAWEKYKMLYEGEFCLVYKSESHIECAGRVDSCEFRPIPTEQEKEASEKLEILKVISERHSGNITEATMIVDDLYAAGLRLPEGDKHE